MASKFQTKIIKEYEKMGYMVINLIRTNKGGIPDLLCLKDGKAVFIECKEGNDTVKLLQKHRIKELRNQGFEAFAIHDKDGIIY